MTSLRIGGVTYFKLAFIVPNATHEIQLCFRKRSLIIVAPRGKDAALEKCKGAGVGPVLILGESYRDEEEDEESGEEIDELHLVGVLVWIVEVFVAWEMGRFCFNVEVNTSDLAL
jgi:hypothetical protein